MYFGIKLPQLLAGLGIHGVDDAPRGRRIHDAIDDERRRLETAIGGRFKRPRQPELGGVGVGDLIERAEALLVVVTAVREPVAAPRLYACQRLVIDRCRRLLLGSGESH